MWGPFTQPTSLTNLSLCSLIEIDWRLEVGCTDDIDALAGFAGRDCSFKLRIGHPRFPRSPDYDAYTLAKAIACLRHFGHNVILELLGDWCDHGQRCFGNRGDEISEKPDYVGQGRLGVSRTCSCTETDCSCKHTEITESELP